MPDRAVGLWAEVWLDGADISAKVSPCLTSLKYTDELDGKDPDKIEVKLEDSAGLFQGQLYPRMGAALRFEFGLDKPGSEIVFKSAHGFQIDRITIAGPPDVVTWKANGQRPGGKFHTRKSRAWENQSLEGIASAIAGEHGMGLLYDGQPVQFKYIAKMRESDNEFLKRLAKQYGILMSLKAGKGSLTLVMADPGKPLSGMKHEIARGAATSFSFGEKVVQGKGGAQATYMDPDSKKAVTEEAPGQGGDHVIRTIGVSQSAGAHIAGTRNDAQKDEGENKLTLPGNPRLLAGANVNLTGWGRNNGEWQIARSEHTLDVANG